MNLGIGLYVQLLVHQTQLYQLSSAVAQCKLDDKTSFSIKFGNCRALDRFCRALDIGAVLISKTSGCHRANLVASSGAITSCVTPCNVLKFSSQYFKSYSLSLPKSPYSAYPTQHTILTQPTVLILLTLLTLLALITHVYYLLNYSVTLLYLFH